MDSEVFNLQNWLEIVGITFEETPTLVVFGVSLLLAIAVGRFTPRIVRLFIRRFSPEQVSHLYENLVAPISGAFQLAGTMLLVSLAMVWLQEDYRSLHDFFKPFVDLALISTMAWLASRLFGRIFRIYGVELLKKVGREVDEMLLVFETVANVIIGFIAVLAFAQSQNFNLVGLFASLGIGGLAIAFAAQKILEQLLSTIVLYLDRPFIPGEYIRLSDGQLGRVESIGLRSTKIRTAAKSTLFILPNSTLLNMEIENVSRAKKVMVMLYLDFTRRLTNEDAALVKQVITQSTNSVFGVDPDSTSIVFPHSANENGRADQHMRRARVTFFILGSSESSIELRKRLLELANETIAERLESYGLHFSMQDPTVYVESPVTL
ncbi:mechanosensitive ion channel [Oscillatoria sp. CS-180]|uniref:mechanosensitive ion channel family protein n=1 Tax=Oscillatoria sp. CS-180 TaxID=3021720 RepID=UPI00232C811A|nr:mechanosensitive ion channel domain-containing protein [Oscillatoria sp. CS-180]MDB9527489.1 mechanosensitive ion channel [Oscillatoria sp. CS-180]